MSTPTASPGMIHMVEAVPDRLEGSPRQLRRFWSDDLSSIPLRRLAGQE